MGEKHKEWQVLAVFQLNVFFSLYDSIYVIMF